MSLAQWAEMPEDEPGELVDGRLEEEELANFVHELVVGLLARWLGNWIALRGGFVFGSDAKFAVQPSRGRKADLSVFFRGRPKPPRSGASRIPPDIMVEVVSPARSDERRDRVDKVVEYAAFGVPWYWLVDPEARTLQILELGADSRYVYALAAADGVVASVPGCEGLSLDLDALWREVDQLEAEEEG